MKKFFEKVLNTKAEVKKEEPNKFITMCSDDIIDFIYSNYNTYQDTVTKYRENGLEVNNYAEIGFALNKIKEVGFKKYETEKAKLIDIQTKCKTDVTALEAEYKLAIAEIEKRYKIKLSNPYGQLLLLRKMRTE